MKKHLIQTALLGLLMAALVGLSSTRLAQAQFTQNRERIQIDPSGFPSDIHRDYKKFAVKCGECHTLDTSLKPSFSAAQWSAIVKEMQAMARAHFNDKEAQNILDFINYDETH